MDAADGISTVPVTGELVNGGPTYGPSTPYGPVGFGWRVPIIVVSPWTRGGFVNSQVFDHTSCLRLLEQRFNLSFATISPWRRAVAGNLTSFFAFDAPDLSWPSLPDTSGYVEQADAECSKYPMPAIPAAQKTPSQEPGTRPARLLPYALYASAAALPAALRLTVESADAGAAFQLYDHRALAAAPRKYTVGPGQTVSDLLGYHNASYHVSLFGPNGFVREFSGSPDADCAVSPLPYATADGSLALRLSANASAAAPCLFTVTPNAYLPAVPAAFKVAPGQSVVSLTSVNASGNWYDVSVQTPLTSVRLMGRIERPGSTSDPAMAQGPPSGQPQAHPDVPQWVRKYRDTQAGTHKDHRCFQAEQEVFFQDLCQDEVAWNRALN